jgi:hypothetical protein
LEQALPAGGRILLDSSTLVAYLDGGELVSPIATHVVDQLVSPGRNRALVSMVTVMELLVKPRQREIQGYQHLLDFLTKFPHLGSQRRLACRSGCGDVARRFQPGDPGRFDCRDRDDTAGGVSRHQ